MTTPLRTVTSAVVPLLRDDIDTDQIIPARYLKSTERDGLGEGLFRDWRVDGEGQLREPRFVLDEPDMAGRSILLTGHNFGCGSSREHAPWALLESGFRAVLATGFGDIFRSNALKNGLLPIALEPGQHGRIRDVVASTPSAALTIDLVRERIDLPDSTFLPFTIDPFARQMILAGTDQLGWLLERSAAIAAYEATHTARFDTRAPAGDASS